MSADIELSVDIEASPATVYRLLTDPQRMLAWMGTEVSLDARPGGALLINITGSDVAEGSFVELVQDRRVVFTWGWRANDSVPPGSTTVEIDLEVLGDGTRLRLRHRNLPDASAADGHEVGWMHYASRLAAVAAGQDPGPDSFRTTEP